MLGLIATLTPILYKHVADRREDIDNINEANTLLLIKNATKDYIEANKDVLSVGTTLLEPVDVGVDIDGYKIGIKKDSDGNINAMIAASDGSNDMKAAKVASLLGVSAGIYSAQDATRAWGINGVWAENVSNYGFTSLPAGIPVVTTTYDEEDSLDMEKIFTAIEEHSFEKLTAKELCLDNDELPEEERCITKWKEETCPELVEFCNNGIKCHDAYSKRCNLTCNDILIGYRAEGMTPQSNYDFRLTGSNSNGEANKTKCYFTSTTGYNAIEIIEACNGGNTEACSLANTYSLNTSCQKIINAYKTLNQTPSNGTFKLGAAGTSTACWFKDTTGYSTKEVIEKCNAGTTIACQMGSENKLNRTCAELQTAMKSYGAIPANGSFKLTLTSTTGSSYTCDMSQTPALTEYFYKNTAGTYTFSLLSKKIQYKFEVCGASNYGGRTHGGYSWGKKIHNSAQSFFVIVGGIGGVGTYGASSSGGGTEIRFGTSSWVDKHRILVGGGSSGYNASATPGAGGGGNNCGGGGAMGGCKGVGGRGYGNPNTPGTIGHGGASGWSRYAGTGGNGGGYGGGGGGGGNWAGYGGGGGGGFGGGGQGGSYGWGAGASGTATNGGGGTTGYNGGYGQADGDGGFGGGGGSDWGSGGGGYGGGGGGGRASDGTTDLSGGGGGGRVCLATMPAGWPACDPAVWVFDEGSGETGSDKCPGTGWVKISVIEIKE